MILENLREHCVGRRLGKLRTDHESQRAGEKRFLSASPMTVPFDVVLREKRTK